MRVRTLLTLIILVLVAGLVIVNWSIFAAPATIDLVVTAVSVPLGVLTLALCAVSLLVFMGYAGLWQGALLMEFRRQARELQAQRTLAESAEASRFTELAKLLRDEFANSERRLEAAVESLRREFKETENSIAATLAEMDDRIVRGTNARGPNALAPGPGGGDPAQRP